jgi:hypothetical protein
VKINAKAHQREIAFLRSHFREKMIICQGIDREIRVKHFTLKG